MKQKNVCGQQIPTGEFVRINANRKHPQPEKHYVQQKWVEKNVFNFSLN